MNEDDSVQAVLFRLRKGIGSGDQALKNYKNNCLRMYGRPYLPTRGKIPTIIGKRNGVPIGSDQDYYQQQRNVMFHRTTRPYKSNELRDILPTIYNGNVNMLASSGGAPLAFALDDDSELQERLYSEGIRGSLSNPLSARFAMNAHHNREPPIIGGQTDIMRRELEGHQDDEETMARKLQSGHLGNQAVSLISGAQLDPEIEAFKNQMRPPTKKDFDGYNSKFQATVDRLHGSTVGHLTNLHTQLNSINNRARMHGSTLNNIYDLLNNYQPAGTTSGALSTVIPVNTVPPSGFVTPVVTPAQSQPLTATRRSSRIANLGPTTTDSTAPTFRAPRARSGLRNGASRDRSRDRLESSLGRS